jgi:hypothetical protein
MFDVQQALAEALQSLETESQIQSEAYRVLRQQDKERLQACHVMRTRTHAVSLFNLLLSLSCSLVHLQVLAEAIAEASRTSLPIDFERRLWCEFVTRPQALLYLMQQLEVQQQQQPRRST